MNASALLSSQGWLGPGHALDSRLADAGGSTYQQKGRRGLAYDAGTQKQITAGHGLVKPLLGSQRGSSRHGIGKKAHEPSSGNEWWLKGFQSALENVGKSESERSRSGTSTPTPTPSMTAGRGYVGKHGGLYGYFVQGQIMKGTLETHETQAPSKKRKSDVLDEEVTAHVPKAEANPVERPAAVQEWAGSIPYLEERDKERRKAHPRSQKTDVEQFAAVGEFLEAVDAQKKGGKGSKDVAGVGRERTNEEREERRARRPRRTGDHDEDQDRKTLTLAQMVDEELARLSSMNNSEEEPTSDGGKEKRMTGRKKKRQKDKVIVDIETPNRVHV